MDKSTKPLFPRDEAFHAKTGQVKSKRKTRSGDVGVKQVKGDKYDRAVRSRDQFTGGDPIAWLCGRLLGFTTKSKSDPRRVLSELFKKYDKLGYGSLEMVPFKGLLKENDIIADDEVVIAVCEKFRDVRNKTVTLKFDELIDWTMKNCGPIKKWSDNAEEEKDGEEEKEEEEKDGEEEKEESEEKKDDSEGLYTYSGESGELEVGFTTVADMREARCNDVIDTTDSAGRTALHFASAIGDAICVKMLVKFGASCEKRASDNESALSYAGSRIVRSSLINSMLKELEEAKFSVSRGQRKKLQDWIIMLGEGGLNVNDPLGGLDLHTPLHIAAIAGLSDVVSMLLEKRALWMLIFVG